MPKITEARRQARQCQILDAATRCFSRSGFHGTSMEDIVRESGLSPGAIYCHFRGKHEIVEAISVQRHARDSELLAAFASSPNVGEALKTVSRALVAMLGEPKEKQRRKVSILFWAESLLDRKIRKVAERGIRQRDRLTAALRDAQQTGELAANLDVESVSRVMLALLQGLILQQAWEPGLDIEGYVTTAVRLIGAALSPDRTMTSSAKSPRTIGLVPVNPRGPR